MNKISKTVVSPAALAQLLSESFAALPQARAVALGGSRAGGQTDAASDIDLYVFTAGEIPLAERRRIMEHCGGATRADLGLDFWGPGDEWFHASSGIEVDVVYFDAAWMEAQLRRVLVECQPSLGYSTCLWYTLRQCQPLADPHGWLAGLQAQAAQPYPEALRRSIIAFNHPVLRGVIPAYAHQIEKALRRDDRVSVNHRLAALLASYFDILFAFNRELHPGEKRLLALTQARCARLPVELQPDLDAVLRAGGVGGDDLLPHLTRLLDRLDALLAEDDLP